MRNIDTLIQHFGRSYKKAEHVFYEGEPGREIFLVHEGEIRIYKTIKGRERTLSVMRKDDFFGEVSALTGIPRTASAVALRDSVLIVFPEALMEKIIVSQSEVAVRLLRRMALRLKHADEMISILMEKNHSLRVVLGLLHLLDKDGYETEMGVEVPFAKEEFSAQFDIDGDVIEKVIGELIKRAIISETVDGEKIVVKDAEELSEFYRYLELSEKFGSGGSQK